MSAPSACVMVHEEQDRGGFTFSVRGGDGSLSSVTGRYATWASATIAGIVHAASLGFVRVVAETEDGEPITWTKK